MHEASLSGKRFFEVTLLNAGITLIEFIGGLLSGSLSLLSDAVHNLSDALSIVLSYIAHRIGLRRQTKVNTYGYKRAEILSAFINAAILLLISVGLIAEAASRLRSPQKINGTIMFYVALFSVVANLCSTLLLNRGAKHNLNIKATYLHLLADTLSSVGVVIGAIIIRTWAITWVDPLITLLVSLYIIREAWHVVTTTVSILMQAAPQLDYKEMAQDILQLPNVVSIHHLHVWSVDEHTVIFEAHVNMRDVDLESVEHTDCVIEKLLEEKYHISHVTIQPEFKRGLDQPLFFDKNDYPKHKENK
ncbi:cation diffusion facilitator family transporter [Loigolactobacillus iwatensis]|uniref:cation diffusion facilitator family transporter n=1 Tax=Loigolactobacillus iwatensis TaxID=1267156 RepID=UPI000F7EEA19|nr:cation diffusion facilitator family transporter [Loigolactobacillus iwatensis]